MRHLSLLFNKVDRVAIPIFRYYIHTMFVIEDESHAEPQSGVYQTFDDALKELRRRAEISWDKEPNQAPCTSWRSCGRRYEIIEYDTSTSPWNLLSRFLALEIDAEGVRWFL